MPPSAALAVERVARRRECDDFRACPSEGSRRDPPRRGNLNGFGALLVGDRRGHPLALGELGDRTGSWVDHDTDEGVAVVVVDGDFRPSNHATLVVLVFAIVDSEDA